MRSVMLCAALALAGPLRAESVTVALWGSGPAEVVAFDRAIAAFTRATGIKVEKQVIADRYMDVLKSRFAGHKPPDAFYVDSSEAPLLIASGVLKPLASHIVAPDDFYPQFLEAFRGPDRKLYGIPKDYATLALYLNPDLLRRAGLRPDQVPTHFSELMRFCRQLQARLPAGIGAMLVEKELARHLAAMEAQGQPVITPEGYVRLVGNTGAYSYLNELVTGRARHYLLSAKDDLGADWPGAAFGTGKVAMMMEGNWIQTALKNDYGGVPFQVREMPTINGHKQTMAYIVGYAVAREARHKAAAFQFVRFMTGPGLRTWVEAAGTLPVRKSLEQEMAVRANPALAPHVDGARYATVWSRGDALPIVDLNFGSQFLAAFNGATPLDVALRKAEAVSNREIARQR